MANGSYIWTAVYEVKTTGDTVILACGRSEDWTNGVVEDIFYNGVSIKTAVTTTYDVVDNMDGNPNVMYRFPTTGLQEVQLLINSEKLMLWSTNSESVFSNTRTLVSIDIPDEVTEIPDCCFRWCSKLSAVTFSENMTVIPANCFDYTNFNCFVIPDNILSASCPTEVAAYLGSEYNKLEYLTLGQSLQFMSFKNAHAQHFKAFYCKPTVCPTTDFYAGHPSNVILYYPAGSNYSAFDAAYPNEYTYVPLSTFPVDTCSTYVPTPDPPIPSGQTIDSGSTSHTITYSGCPLVFDHSASTGTWNTLPTVTTGGTTDDWWITYDVPANDTDSARTITYYYLRYSGQSCSDLVDTVSYTISQAAGSGSTPTDSYIRFSESARTVNGNAGGTSVVLDYSGCTPYGGSKAFSATGTLDVTGVSVFHGYDSVTCSISFPSNTGSTSLQADVRVEFDDTSGNTYYDTIHVTQGVQTDINFNPSTHEIQGQANRVTSTAVPLNCTISSITFSAITYTSGTWDEYPTYTINGNDVTFRVPANDTNAMRILIYNFNITDTDGNVYNKSITIVQMVQNRLVYLDPTGRTISASGYGTYVFNIKGSGCSIDSSYTPTFTFSGDTSWINSISSVTFNDSGGRWYVSYYSPRNLGDSSREVYITVNGVHDTDGNVYNGLVYKATQNYGSYVFLNYDKEHDAPSGSSVETIEVVPVNTTVCSISVTSASSTPDLWTGVTQPTVTVLGNYITVNWPQNPHTSERNLQLTVQVVWGESCENTTTLSFNKYQNGAQTPVQKDIKAADAEYSVGSGSGNASTTVLTSGCTYDHFTYVTGGSFSVTVTSGPNNTIVFTYPENPTTTARTGYVYITFYDSDGNTYGPQTITFTQQAGSSPGPGPGPDPETGYVLTTLTISDQEQHRYFVEARPGVVYSAAGQYYKTISACEARYSLYYVNSYGGVDVLPFKEKGWKKSDTVTRFNYSRSFRNNTPEFENVNYMNEIKASWELHTGWMSDESSQRMHELIESTIVYLYDAEERTYTPVVMTDKKLEYKTYHNQGKKFYNYTVNVEESQSKERR